MSRESRGRGSSEMDGNALASAAAFGREMIERGEVISRFERAVGKAFDEDMVYVEGFRVKIGDGGSESVLVVVTGHIEGEPVVAFHTGDSLVQALVSLVRRIEKRNLKWKPDEFRKDKS